MSKRSRTYCMLAKNLDTNEIVGYFDDYLSSFYDYRASTERVFIRQIDNRSDNTFSSERVLKYFDKQKEVFKKLLGVGNWDIFISNINSPKCPIRIDWKSHREDLDMYRRGRNKKDKKHSATSRSHNLKLTNLKFCVK